MAMVIDDFGRIAAAVTERTAELLASHVAVVDDYGFVIASSDHHNVGQRAEPFGQDSSDGYLRVPLRLTGQSGEVIVAAPANGEVISPRLGQALVELVINQTAVVARLPNQNELKDKFIHDVLRGAIEDEAGSLREGQILGMDFTRPRAVILIDAFDYIVGPRDKTRHADEASETRARRRAQLVIASIVGFFALPDDTICGYIGNGEVVVLKASGTQDLAAWTDDLQDPEQCSSSWANLAALKRAGSALATRLRHDAKAGITIGIGRYHPGLRGLARSYEDARVALSLGRRFHGQNGVHCLDALGIAAFVGVPDERTKIELAAHLLSPLDHEPDLLDTLAVFFNENCCPSATAHRLSIHRNTLGYRLDKIASLTGLDPRCFDDAVQIRLALVLRSLR